MVQLLTLPPELLIKIVDQVAVAWDGHSHFLRSRDDPLIALSSTSHLLRHFSLPALFATLTLRASCPASLASTVELVKTCDGIRNHPEIPKLVTRLRIDCRPSRLDGASFDRANPSYLGGVLDQPFCRLVRSLARLREFNAFVDGQAEPIDISPALVYSLIASPSLEVVDLRRVYCANPIKPVPSPSPRSTPSPAGTSTPSERPRLRPIAIKLGSSYSSSLSILDAFCDALDRNPALDYFLASIEVREHINTIGPASKGFAPGAWLTLRKIELSDFVINGAKDAVLDSLTARTPSISCAFSSEMISTDGAERPRLICPRSRDLDPQRPPPPFVRPPPPLASRLAPLQPPPPLHRPSSDRRRIRPRPARRRLERPEKVSGVEAVGHFRAVGYEESAHAGRRNTSCSSVFSSPEHCC